MRASAQDEQGKGRSLQRENKGVSKHVLEVGRSVRAQEPGSDRIEGLLESRILILPGQLSFR